MPRFQVEKRYVRASGEVVWALLTVSLVHDSSGAAVYASAQILDIGVAKAAENKLDASVIVASVQTLSRYNRPRQLYGNPEES
jgi:hypothetical protein